MKEVIANAATQGGTALLRLEHVGKIYGNKDAMTCALDDVSLTVDRREFVAIMGPSGSGKSTLLNCIATIDTATSGHIWLAGQDITRMRGAALAKFRRDQLGFIFQDSNLLDTLTAHENIALALSLKGRPPARDRSCSSRHGAHAGRGRRAGKIPCADVGRSAPTCGGSARDDFKPAAGAGR